MALHGLLSNHGVAMAHSHGYTLPLHSVAITNLSLLQVPQCRPVVVSHGNIRLTVGKWPIAMDIAVTIGHFFTSVCFEREENLHNIIFIFFYFYIFLLANSYKRISFMMENNFLLFIFSYK